MAKPACFAEEIADERLRPRGPGRSGVRSTGWPHFGHSASAGAPAVLRCSNPSPQIRHGPATGLYPWIGMASYSDGQGS